MFVQTEITFGAKDARCSASDAGSRTSLSKRESCCAHIVSQPAHTGPTEPAPEQLADFRRLGVELIRQAFYIVFVMGERGFEVFDLARQHAR